MSESDNGESGADKGRSQRETPDPRPPAERDITEGYRPPEDPLLLLPLPRLRKGRIRGSACSAGSVETEQEVMPIGSG